MNIPDDIPYKIASSVMKQGMECDTLARFIRQSINAYLESQLDIVKEEMGDNYNKNYERDLKRPKLYDRSVDSDGSLH